MTPRTKDPVAEFEHTHDQLTRLAAQVGELVHSRSAAAGKQLVARLDVLREELLRHFAIEEEGFFPFVRSHVPAKAELVDRLEGAHDAICGALLRLAHVASAGSGAPTPERRTAMLALHDRFERTYAEHSRHEAELFDELSRVLDARQRKELGELLRGL